MKLKAIFLGLILVTSGFLNAQTNDQLKKESDKNKQEGTHKREKGDNPFSGNDSNDDSKLNLIIGAVRLLCWVVYELGSVTAQGLMVANDNINDHEKDVPRIKSLEIGANAGYINPGSSLLMPSLKLRGGLFSTSVRVFSNTEHDFNSNNNYSTINWQILQLNVAVKRKINVAIGTGIMYETYSKMVFNEFGLNWEFYPGKNLYIPLEFRYTPDYGTGKTILFETYTGVGYTVKKWRNSSLRFQANYTFAKYYEVVNVHGLSLGLNLLVDAGRSRVKRTKILEEIPEPF